MNKLSVVLATLNEEKNLTDCLESVLDLADEIVVVDGGSTDKTVEIAKKYSAKVIITDNPPNFHINKQKAINAASGEWILQLDADERVTEELKKEIKSRITNYELRITESGFWIPRKNWFLGRFLTKGGQYPDYTLRLYRKGKGELPQKDVHEQAIVEGEVGHLTQDLLHMADPELTRYLIRLNRYTSFIASQLKQEKIKKNATSAINYLILKPGVWFFLRYFRNRGYVDGVPGFLFAAFSAVRFPIAYMKYISTTYE